MPRAGISLGSNLGDRRANLRAAVDRLRKIANPGELFLEAPIYETEPVDCPAGSEAFLNSVIEIGFNGDAFELLGLTRQIEADLGRQALRERNAPRPIDLDLLYFGNQIIDSEVLVLPHPRLCQRRFVLQPLADIRPELVLPGMTQSIGELLALQP